MGASDGVVTIDLRIPVDGAARDLNQVKQEIKTFQEDMHRQFKDGGILDEMFGGANKAQSKLNVLFKNIEDATKGIQNYESASNSYDRDRYRQEVNRKNDTIGKSISDLFESKRLAQDLVSGIEEAVRGSFVSGIRAAAPDMMRQLNLYAKKLTTSKSSMGAWGDKQIAQQFYRSPQFAKIFGKQMSQNPTVFSQDNMIKMLRAAVPIAAPQYTRSKYNPAETYRPTTFREMLPKAWAQIPTQATSRQQMSAEEKANVFKGMKQGGQIDRLMKMVRSNEVAMRAAERAGIVERKNGNLYYNNNTNRGMINAMAGYVMRDAVNGARGQAKYGILDVEDPKNFRSIAAKTNKTWTGALNTMRGMQDIFGSDADGQKWFRPGYYNDVKPFRSTPNNSIRAGRIALSPSTMTNAYAEYTLDMLKRGANIDGVHPYEIDESTGKYVAITDPERLANRKANGITDKSYHTITLGQSLQQDVLARHGQAVGHNGFNNNAVYLQIDKELSNPLLPQTKEDRLALGPDSGFKYSRDEYQQMYRDAIQNGITANGRHASFTRFNKEHAQFVFDDIIKSIGAGSFEEGMKFFWNGAEKDTFDTFKDFTKSLDVRNKLATDGQNISQLWGVDQSKLKTVVADFKMLNDAGAMIEFMNGANIISDQIASESFQGRAYGAKATYSKMNMEALFDLYKDYIYKGDSPDKITGAQKGDLVLPGVGLNGADLVIPKDTALIEDVSNIKNYKNSFDYEQYKKDYLLKNGSATEDQIRYGYQNMVNASRTASNQKYGIYAKTTYDDANTSNRWMSHQLVQALSAGFNDPEVNRFFDDVFMDELMKLEDDQQVRSLLFDNDQNIDLTSDAAQAKIKNYQSMLFQRRSQNDVLLPSGVQQYRMAAPNFVNVVNQALKNAGKTLTKEQMELALQEGQVALLGSTMQELGLARYPATAGGNQQAINAAAAHPEFAAKFKKLGIDPSGLYFAPDSKMLQLMQTEDFDGDINAVFEFGAKNNSQSAKFAQVMQKAFKLSQEKYEEILQNAGNISDEQRQANKDLRTKSTVADRIFSGSDANDIAFALVNGQKDAGKMGQASSVITNAWQYGVSPRVAKAMLDAEDHYDVVSTFNKQGKDYEMSPEEKSISYGGATFSQLFNWAAKAVASDDDKNQVWTEDSQKAMSIRNLDMLNLPSVFSGSTLHGLMTRFVAKQRGLNINGTDGEGNVLYNWDQILGGYQGKTDNKYLNGTTLGSFRNRMMQLRADFANANILGVSDNWMYEMKEMRDTAIAETLQALKKEPERAGMSYDALYREAQNIVNGAGGTSFANLRKYGLTESNIAADKQLVDQYGPMQAMYSKAQLFAQPSKQYSGYSPAEFYKKNIEDIVLNAPGQDEATDAMVQKEIQAEKDRANKQIAQQQEQLKQIDQQEKAIAQKEQQIAETKQKDGTLDRHIALRARQQELRNELYDLQKTPVPQEYEGRPQNDAQAMLYHQQQRQAIAKKQKQIDDIDEQIKQESAEETILEAQKKALAQKKASVQTSMVQSSQVRDSATKRLEDYIKRADAEREKNAIIGDAEDYYNNLRYSVRNAENRLDDNRTYADYFADKTMNGANFFNNKLTQFKQTAAFKALKPEQQAAINSMLLGDNSIMNLSKKQIGLRGQSSIQKMLEDLQDQEARRTDVNYREHKANEQMQERFKSNDAFVELAKKYRAQASEEAKPQWDKMISDMTANNNQAKQQWNKNVAAQQEQQINGIKESLQSISDMKVGDPFVSLRNGVDQTRKKIDEMRDKLIATYKDQGLSQDKARQKGHYETMSTSLAVKRAYDRDVARLTEDKLYQGQSLKSMASGLPLSEEYQQKHNNLMYRRKLEDFQRLKKGDLWRSVFGERSIDSVMQDFEATGQRKSQYNKELTELRNSNRIANIKDQNALAMRQFDYGEQQFRRQRTRMTDMSMFGRFYDMQKQHELQYQQKADSLTYNISQKEREVSELEKLASTPGLSAEQQKKANANLDAANAQLAGYQSQLQAVHAAQSKMNTSSMLMSAGFDTIAASVGRLVSKLGRQTLMKAFNEVRKFTLEFDSSMKEIQAITMKSDDQTASLGKRYIELAKNMKVPVKDITSVAGSLYRQGLSDSEVETRLQDVVKFSKVAGIKTTEATQIITTALQNGLVDNSTEAMDTLVALGDSAATTASQIGKAMKKCAASASVAGVSYAELTAMLTTMTSMTQLSGQQVGTAMNTILTRMHSVTTSGYTKDINGETTGINEVEKALALAGISLRESDNVTWRGTSDVLLDISRNWNSMSDVQRSNVATAVAGTRGGNMFNTLMEGMAEDNGETFAKYLGLASDSEGITTSKYEVIIDSIQSKMDALKSTFDGIVNDFETGGVTGGLIDFGTNILGLIDNVTTAAPGAAVAIGLVAAAVAGLATAFGLAHTALGPIGWISGLAAIVAGAGGLSLTGLLFGNNENAREKQIQANYSKATNFANVTFDNINKKKSTIESLEKEVKLYQQAAKAGKDFDTSNIESGVERLKQMFPGLGDVISAQTGTLEYWLQIIQQASAAVSESEKTSSDVVVKMMQMSQKERLSQAADDLREKWYSNNLISYTSEDVRNAGNNFGFKGNVGFEALYYDPNPSRYFTQEDFMKVVNGSNLESSFLSEIILLMNQGKYNDAFNKVITNETVGKTVRGKFADRFDEIYGGQGYVSALTDESTLSNWIQDKSDNKAIDQKFINMVSSLYSMGALSNDIISFYSNVDDFAEDIASGFHKYLIPGDTNNGTALYASVISQIMNAFTNPDQYFGAYAKDIDTQISKDVEETILNQTGDVLLANNLSNVDDDVRTAINNFILRYITRNLDREKLTIDDLTSNADLISEAQQWAVDLYNSNGVKFVSTNNKDAKFYTYNGRQYTSLDEAQAAIDQYIEDNNITDASLIGTEKGKLLYGDATVNDARNIVENAALANAKKNYGTQLQQITDYANAFASNGDLEGFWNALNNVDDLNSVLNSNVPLLNLLNAFTGKVNEDGTRDFINGSKYFETSSIARIAQASLTGDKGLLEEQNSRFLAAIFGTGFKSRLQSGTFGTQRDKNELLAAYADPVASAYLESVIGSYEGLSDVLTKVKNGTQLTKKQQQDLYEAMNKAAMVARNEYAAMDKAAASMEYFSKDASKAANASKSFNQTLTSVYNNQYYREKYRSGDRSQETLSAISGMTGRSTKQLQDKNVLDQVLKELDLSESSDIKEVQDTLATALQESLNEAVSNNEFSIEGDLNVSAEAGQVNVSSGSLQSALAGKLTETQQQLIAILQQYGIAWHAQVDGSLESGSIQIVVDGLGKGGKGGGGGGGGGGKTAAQKFLENLKRENSMRDHILKMYQYEQTTYANRGEYTNENTLIEKENVIRQKNQKLMEDQLNSLKRELSTVAQGSDDWYSLREAILSTEEAIKENSNTIEQNTRKIKENNKAKLKTKTTIQEIIRDEIEQRKQQQRDEEDGYSEMQQTILNVFKTRMQQEWDLLKRDIDKKKEALEQQKQMIDERLNKRKNAADEAKKYEELAEYQSQLAAISMDSTRTKDAAQLRDKIAKLQEEIGWDIAQAEAESQKQTIDDQIEGYDKYTADYEQFLSDMLSDDNNFAEQVAEVMKMNKEEMTSWLQENDQQYRDSLDGQRVLVERGWGDTFDKMIGYIETYWEFIQKIMEYPESFYEYMQESMNKDFWALSSEEREQQLNEWMDAWDQMEHAYDDSQLARDYEHVDEQEKQEEAKEEGRYKATYSLVDYNGNDLSGYGVGSSQAAAQGSARAVASAKPNADMTKFRITSVNKYLQGGLVDYTGPAWVDGTPGKPEAFLSADDTAMMRSFLNLFDKISVPTTYSIDTSRFGGSSTSIGDINVTINEAEFNDDSDYDEIANKVGQAFVKQLSMNGFGATIYNF